MNNTKDFDFIKKRVEHLIKKAGALIADKTVTSITAKVGHANYVTNMDIKVQQFLVNELKPLIPNAVFILEEQDIQPVPGEYTWVIDPIDGTQNFINDFRHSAISVALYQKSEGILGAVFNPFLEELFFGIRDGGAYLNEKPIKVSTRPFNQAIVALGTAPYYSALADKTFDIAKKLFKECADFRRSGSAALDICYIACGRLDAYYELMLSPWDYGAASIILKEAGGIIDAIHPTVFYFTQKSGIIAATADIFKPFCSIVESL